MAVQNVYVNLQHAFVIHKEHFPPVTLNLDLWPWSTNMTRIWSRSTITPNI